MTTAGLALAARRKTYRLEFQKVSMVEKPSLY